MQKIQDKCKYSLNLGQNDTTTVQNVLDLYGKPKIIYRNIITQTWIANREMIPTPTRYELSSRNVVEMMEVRGLLMAYSAINIPAFTMIE
jgi:hypothetical protein